MDDRWGRGRPAAATLARRQGLAGCGPTIPIALPTGSAAVRRRPSRAAKLPHARVGGIGDVRNLSALVDLPSALSGGRVTDAERNLSALVDRPSADSSSGIGGL